MGSAENRHSIRPRYVLRHLPDHGQEVDVKSNLGKRRTSVVYDDTQVSLDALTRATKDAGFPSTVTGVEQVMPTDACQWLYECEDCHAILRPKTGDCCVFCSYGTVPCPPIQGGDQSGCERVC